MYTLALRSAGSFALQVHSLLFTSPGTDTVVSWNYVRCSTTQFALVTGNDTVTCVACPVGGRCDGGTDVTSDGTSAGIVQLSDVVAQDGYWAAPDSTTGVFYQCPVVDACVSGGNGTRALCSPGYTGVLCSVCDAGYFEQFGRCASVRFEKKIGFFFPLPALVVIVTPVGAGAQF